jgi:hypothetical protein
VEDVNVADWYSLNLPPESSGLCLNILYIFSRDKEQSMTAKASEKLQVLNPSKEVCPSTLSGVTKKYCIS